MNDLLVVLLTLMGVVWLFIFLGRGANLSDLKEYKKHVLDPSYGYQVQQEELNEILKEVVNGLPLAKRKMLTNVKFHFEKSTPNIRKPDGSSIKLFGFYNAMITFYPNALFEHNKSYSEYREHFESLVKHEIAHHFGMTEEDIDNNRKKLGITR